MTGTNPLRRLEQFGQSVWLDYIRRQMITSGELQRLIDEDGLKGITSNPAIFEKAIAGSRDYDEAIRTLVQENKSVPEIYHELTVADVQMAADAFRPLYDRLDGKDGFVSLEVNPHLARDTEGTVAEARQLWEAVNRPNILIKVPGTQEGLPAITRLISEGINVNVTLLFGLTRYEQVAEAYLAGLEALLAKGGSLSRVASVASFFLSRIDVLLDPILEKMATSGGDRGEKAREVVGEVAIACAKMAYAIYQRLFAGQRFPPSSSGVLSRKFFLAHTASLPDRRDCSSHPAGLAPLPDRGPLPGHGFVQLCQLLSPGHSPFDLALLPGVTYFMRTAVLKSSEFRFLSLLISPQ